MKKWLLCSILIIFKTTISSADNYPKNPKIDVLNYTFRIELSDNTDEIKCEVTLDVRYLGANVEVLRLDLVKASLALANKGMKVTSVTSADKPLTYTHENDELKISFDFLKSHCV